MIRRGVQVQLVVFLAITVVGLSFVSARYVGLGNLLLGSGYVVTADFPESGGIFENAEVTYRGVAIGRVDRLRLARDGVHVDLRIDSGTKVPRDTVAVVENRSAVGEQYVDLQPRAHGGPFLSDGDRVSGPGNRTPLHTETLLLNLNRLVTSVDKADLVTVIDELGAAFAGTGPDLQRLLDSGDALTRAATDNLEPTIRLIRDGRTVLDTQRDSGSAIQSFSTDLADLSQTLRSSDGDLRAVLDNGVVASTELQDLIRTNRADISALLANLLTSGQVTVTRLHGVEQVLVTYPDNVGGGYTVVPGDATSHFGLVLNASDPPVCTKGYGGTRKRQPRDTSDAPANTDARCAQPRGSASSVRGAQNAPAPTGRSARVAPVWPSYLGGYDATSGLAYGTGGAPLQLRSPGGAPRTLRKDSWTWLLLGPMSR